MKVGTVQKKELLAGKSYVLPSVAEKVRETLDVEEVVDSLVAFEDLVSSFINGAAVEAHGGTLFEVEFDGGEAVCEEFRLHQAVGRVPKAVEAD